jgi:hypothetical protein
MQDIGQAKQGFVLAFNRKLHNPFLEKSPPIT